MAFTSTQLQALDNAISQGVLQVQYADRRVTYQSLDDMLRLRDTMRAELGIQAPSASRSRVVNIVGGKGL